jgi:catechol 2,3-dioxygenase-like lactoylglutathione lyase family enzyme
LEKPLPSDGSYHADHDQFHREVRVFTSFSVCRIFVLDQDEALDFYAGTLGLEVSSDFQQGSTRWLTVRVPGQPGPDIYLEQPGPPGVDEATASQIREMVTKGALGFLAFITDDCRKTYETLLARGVEFTQEPVEHFYGIDCGIRDPFGNQIRILQPAQRAEQEPASVS